MGSFVGRDSLDTRKEPATLSRVRSDLHGSATWTIELDSLDLRQKFTLRLEIPEPSPVTIVLRSLDSLPPRPGQYTVMLPSTGASHSRAGTMHGEVYAREGSRDRRYIVDVSRLVITSSTISDGRPVVSGNVALRVSRYADAPPKTLVFDYVSMSVGGDFAARAASVIRPQVVVTPRMQEIVLRRALDGFAITHAGAINGDGSADSTRQSGLATRFLESRWRDAAIVEHMQTTGMQYEVRLRGRQVPVVCEMESTREEIECAQFPAPMINTAGAAPGTVRGRVNGTLAANDAGVVRLLPNPVPFRQAFQTWCDKRDKRDSIAEQAFMAKLESLKDTAAQTAAVEQWMNDEILSFRTAFRDLLSSYTVQRVAIGNGGQFAFSAVPAGNYLVVSSLSGKEREYEWYVPITIHGGERIAQDLNDSNAATHGAVCGMQLPFPATHEKSGKSS